MRTVFKQNWKFALIPTLIFGIIFKSLLSVIIYFSLYMIIASIMYIIENEKDLKKRKIQYYIFYGVLLLLFILIVVTWKR